MTRSTLWSRTGTAADRSLGSGDALPQSSDVVVVGAGITGLATALEAASAGRSVTVVEARHAGSGTTGRSTAKLSLLQGTRLSSIARQHPAGTVEAYVQANLAAQRWLLALCERLGVPAQRRPAVTYATSGAGARRVRRELDLARGAGLPAVWADRDDDLPFPITGAVRLPEQAQVDPVALVAAMLREAREIGVRVVEGARVTRVTGDEPVRVSTTGGETTAGLVVVATGTPILDRGGFFARQTPQRSYTIAYRTRLPAVAGMYLSADTPSRSLRDVPDREEGPVLLVGGAGHATGRVVDHTDRLQQLRDWTADWYPDAEELEAWSAQDYEPARQLPFVGPVLPGSPHVWVAGGFAKWGMTNGPAAALAVGGHLRGVTPAWAEVMHPWRARELRATPRLVADNAAVGWEMTRGWLRPLVPGRAAGGVRPSVRGLPVTDAGDAPSLGAVCTHLGGVVTWNQVESSWDCPLHGSRFDADGEVLDGPAVCGLRRRG